MSLAQRLLLFILGGAGALWQAAAMAQNNAAPSAPAQARPTDDPDDADSDKPVRFRIELVAPGELRALIRNNVDLYRWRNSDAVTSELLSRLAREAADEVRAALATEGYFSPVVESALKAAPEGTQVVTLSAQPGPRTHIGAFAIDLRGDIDTDPSRDERLKALRGGWKLREGKPFRQEDWDRAKRGALELLSQRDYPTPRVTDSRAEINPPAASASLGLRIDSGPKLRFGAIDVQGLARYEPARVRNFAAFRYGDDWDREKITRFQRRLTASGYFASAQIELDSDAAKDGIAPVKVRVIEAPPRQLELGGGYSTNAKITASASWRDQNLFGSGLRWRNDLRVDALQQSASTTFELPETGGGWVRSLGAEYKHTDVQQLATDDLTFSGRIRSLEERKQVEWGVQDIHERATPSGELTARSHATLFEYGRTWRSYDDLLAPTRGGALQAVAGVAPGAVATRSLARVIVRSQWLQPLMDKLDLSLRAEGGAVLSSSRTGVPQALLFRMGGDTDLRGYAYQSVGIRKGDVVSGARRYLLGSVEVTRWITDSLGAAGFVDGGDAFDSDQPLKLKTGYGFGIRVRTPIGPVRADLAWAERSRSPRLHFSVGVQF